MFADSPVLSHPALPELLLLDHSITLGQLAIEEHLGHCRVRVLDVLPHADANHHVVAFNETALRDVVVDHVIVGIGGTKPADLSDKEP